MEITRRNLNIQPTITIRVGYRFNVRVNKDIADPDQVSILTSEDVRWNGKIPKPKIQLAEEQVRLFSPRIQESWPMRLSTAIPQRPSVHGWQVLAGPHHCGVRNFA